MKKRLEFLILTAAFSSAQAFFCMGQAISGLPSRAVRFAPPSGSTGAVKVVCTAKGGTGGEAYSLPHGGSGDEKVLREVTRKLQAQLKHESALRSTSGLREVDLEGKAGLKVYAISDLHTDYRTSLKWCQDWPDYRKEGELAVLIVAGDLSSDLAVFTNTLEACTAKFDEVFFVAGNHDVWVTPTNNSNQEVGQSPNESTSLHKLSDLLQACTDSGVHTTPTYYRNAAGMSQDIWVFPLLSWYHASWDTEPELPEDLYESMRWTNMPFTSRWMDFHRCTWPHSLVSPEDFKSIESDSTALSDFFAMLNEPCIQQMKACGGANGHDVVLSFSHFLPRQELCPEKRALKESKITKVIGSDATERQVRQLGSNVHVFGHTHIPVDLVVEGTRYVTWPLGSKREQERQCHPIVARGPLLILDSKSTDIIQPVEHTMWGEYYAHNARDPFNFEIAPWVLRNSSDKQKRYSRSREHKH